MKVTYEYEVQGNYVPYGWEMVYCADTREEARRVLKEYRTNAPDCIYRIKRLVVRT